MKSGSKSVDVNGRDYRWPQAPLVVICCDGSEPDYMEMAMAEGLMPNLKMMIAKGENTPRALRDPKFYQSQQSFDRHRRAAGGAWHLRKLSH